MQKSIETFIIIQKSLQSFFSIFNTKKNNLLSNRKTYQNFKVNDGIYKNQILATVHLLKKFHFTYKTDTAANKFQLLAQNKSASFDLNTTNCKL